MYLSKIAVNHLRNLHSIQLELASQFNMLVGQNGSGKTSFLEAIYFLSLARSFRSHQYKPIITHGLPQMTVSGNTNEGTIFGIEKNRDGKTRIRINMEWCKDISTLATILPIQIINPDCYKLLEAGPQYRRKFLDWGVFHVKHQFFKWWQRSNHVLQQRNAALRQMHPRQHILLWDKEFIEIANLLHEMRKEYISLLNPLFKNVVITLLEDEITLDYFCGWNPDINLESVIENAYERDKYLGYTQYGPHRADIIFKVNQLPATQVLSRGQQKLLICALKIAQGMLLQQQSNKSCIYLIDDLTAELDAERRAKVIKLLNGLDTQIFVTSVEENAFQDIELNKNSKLFHVKHGVVK